MTLHVPEIKEDVRGGRTNVYRAFNKNPIKRFFSTEDTEKLKDAILTLIMSGCGYSIKLHTLFDKTANSIEESTLEIKQTGYGIAGFGPRDFWHLIRNGVEVFKADNPHEVVEMFFFLIIENKLGYNYAEL